jgi:hypothetical protein
MSQPAPLCRTCWAVRETTMAEVHIAGHKGPDPVRNSMPATGPSPSGLRLLAAWFVLSATQSCPQPRPPRPGKLQFADA